MADCCTDIGGKGWPRERKEFMHPRTVRISVVRAYITRTGDDCLPDILGQRGIGGEIVGIFEMPSRLRGAFGGIEFPADGDRIELFRMMGGSSRHFSGPWVEIFTPPTHPKAF